MKKILLMFLLFFTIASVPAFARNWVEFTNKRYIDIDSIEPYVVGIRASRKEEYVFWTKNLNDGSDGYKDLEKSYNKKIWYDLSKNVISCQQKTLTLQAIAIYDLKGNVIKTGEIPFAYQEAHSIIPDSVGEIIYSIVCE